MTATTSPEEAAAHRRAMSLQRILANGMEWADAHELHARSEALEPWHLAAQAVGNRTLARAREAAAAGHQRTAQESFLFASAAYRYAQNPLDDDETKRALYVAMMDTYREGVDLLGGVEHVEVPTAAGPLQGWLHRPVAPLREPAPVVLVFGGFDGWREEYHVGARRLVDAGIATLLLDGPGQGETRLFGGVPMPPDPADWSAALREAVTWAGEVGGFGSVAVWGNSMGGYLAARLAADDPRLAAVCINGGSDRPGEVLDRFPRFVSKVQALYAQPDPETAHALLDRHLLQVSDLARVACHALILHGEPDRIFLLASAERLAAGITGPVELRTWPDGDHCLYNHPYERDALIADWFTRVLGPQ